jgi:hypothetical protein
VRPESLETKSPNCPKNKKWRLTFLKEILVKPFLAKIFEFYAKQLPNLNPSLGVFGRFLAVKFLP